MGEASESVRFSLSLRVVLSLSDESDLSIASSGWLRYLDAWLLLYKASNSSWAEVDMAAEQCVKTTDGATLNIGHY